MERAHTHWPALRADWAWGGRFGLGPADFWGYRVWFWGVLQALRWARARCCGERLMAWEQRFRGRPEGERMI